MHQIAPFSGGACPRIQLNKSRLSPLNAYSATTKKKIAYPNPAYAYAMYNFSLT